MPIRRESRSANIVRVAPSKAEVTRLSALKNLDKDIDIIGKVVSVDPVRYFTDLSGRHVSVSSCTLSEGSTNIRMSMWRSSSLYAAEMHPGDYVKAEFVSVKASESGLEISAGDYSRIFIGSSLRPQVRE